MLLINLFLRARIETGCMVLRHWLCGKTTQNWHKTPSLPTRYFPSKAQQNYTLAAMLRVAGVWHLSPVTEALPAACACWTAPLSTSEICGFAEVTGVCTKIWRQDTH